ncbi:hypothetical protein GCM10010921_05670 [Microbacterium album]|uniref:Uncharacterized protein n=1 Tax=Microbacterium album TaxID=2053191 RepID=A0A917MKS7_9MICO|nr:hypothetical protein GCM10010921_05670 [Microbacterium album]
MWENSGDPHTRETARVYVLNDAGDVWPFAGDLAATPGEDQSLVELDGRQIEAARLIQCWRWLFGER